MTQSPRNFRVLLVEDDILIRQIALTILRRFECEVVPVGNGQEALGHVSENWDLVLMDCQMPVLDGFEATRRWRRYETEQKTQRTPIVALTAETLPHELQRCLEVGMDSFLCKPLSAAKVQAVVEQWTKSPSQISVQTLKFQQGDAGGFEELLQDYKGYENVLANLIQSFLKGLPELTRDLKNSIESNDVVLILRQAHKLKGSALALRAHPTAQSLSHLEEIAGDGNRAASEAQFRVLEHELNILATQLKTLLKHLLK